MFKINSPLVRRMMIERGLSLREFAAKAKINGLTASRVIRDGATVTAKVLAKLANFFGVNADSLIITSDANS